MAGREIGISLLKNQRQHRTLRIQNEVLPFALCLPQKALRGGIRGSFFEPLARYWSHFVGKHCQKLTNSVQN